MSGLFRPLFGAPEESVLLTGAGTLLGSHVLKALSEISGNQDQDSNPAGTVFRVKAALGNCDKTDFRDRNSFLSFDNAFACDFQELDNLSTVDSVKEALRALFPELKIEFLDNLDPLVSTPEDWDEALLGVHHLIHCDLFPERLYAGAQNFYRRPETGGTSSSEEFFTSSASLVTQAATVVLDACLRSKSVKRVIVSGAAATSISLTQSSSEALAVLPSTAALAAAENAAMLFHDRHCTNGVARKLQVTALQSGMIFGKILFAGTLNSGGRSAEALKTLSSAIAVPETAFLVTPATQLGMAHARALSGGSDGKRVLVCCEKLVRVEDAWRAARNEALGTVKEETSGLDLKHLSSETLKSAVATMRTWCDGARCEELRSEVDAAWREFRLDWNEGVRVVIAALRAFVALFTLSALKENWATAKEAAKRNITLLLSCSVADLTVMSTQRAKGYVVAKTADIVQNARICVTTLVRESLCLWRNWWESHIAAELFRRARLHAQRISKPQVAAVLTLSLYLADSPAQLPRSTFFALLLTLGPLFTVKTIVTRKLAERRSVVVLPRVVSRVLAKVDAGDFWAVCAAWEQAETKVKIDLSELEDGLKISLKELRGEDCIEEMAKSMTERRMMF